MTLPDQIDMNGEWQDTVRRLYKCFCNIFLTDPLPLVENRPLTIDSRRLDDDKEEGFWHVVSRGPRHNRLPDFNRARCMPWIVGMLDGTAPGLSRWKYTEGSGMVRQYYWLVQENYVLILEEQTNFTVLITAFYVDRAWARDDLIRKQAQGTSF